LTKEDVGAIFIGTQSNVGLSGPPQLIAPQPEIPQPEPAATAAAPPAVGAAPPLPRPGNVPQAGAQQPPVAAPAGAQNPNPPAPPGTTPVPGYVQTPTQPATLPPTLTGQPTPAAPTPGAMQPTIVPPGSPLPPAPTVPPAGQQPPAAQTPPAAAPAAPAAPAPQAGGAPATTPAQITLTSGTEFRVGGGPYNVPISVNNASRISTITLTVTYNPAILGVRTATDGTFMRQGGITAGFTPRMSTGRVDIVITRAGDQTGASGAGLLAGLLFDALAPGTSTITVSAVAMTPDGTPVAVASSPVSVTVR
jgi:hypothetical protein